MNIHLSKREVARTLLLAAICTVPLLAQATGGSPWEQAVNQLKTSFTGPIAKGLSLVAIVIGGITFAFSEHGAQRVLAGIIFGVGMAVAATAFMSWLFTVTG